MKQAVLLIAFNNVKTTKAVLEAILEYQPKKLYVAIDAPRASVESDSLGVAEVKELISQASGSIEFETFYPVANRGPRQMLSSAITWFFEHEEAGIILEHDCLPDPSFFIFCEELLLKFWHTNQVMHIGANFFQQQPVDANSYYFSHIPHIWGWATWRRAWLSYDLAMADWPDFKKSPAFKKILPWFWQRQKWSYIFDKNYQHKANTWDYQWTYALMKNNGLAVNPNRNLVTNIGFGPGAVHSTDLNSPFANMKLSPMSFPLVHPNTISASQRSDYQTSVTNFKFNPLKVLIKNLINSYFI